MYSIVTVCLCVYPVVCNALNFWKPWLGNFIFGMRNAGTSTESSCQGHRVIGSKLRLRVVCPRLKGFFGSNFSLEWLVHLNMYCMRGRYAERVKQSVNPYIEHYITVKETSSCLSFSLAFSFWKIAPDVCVRGKVAAPMRWIIEHRRTYAGQPAGQQQQPAGEMRRWWRDEDDDDDDDGPVLPHSAVSWCRPVP